MVRALIAFFLLASSVFGQGTFTGSTVYTSHLVEETDGVSVTRDGLEGAVVVTVTTTAGDQPEVGVNTADEETLVSFTFPANSLIHDGKIVKAEGFGEYSSSGPPNGEATFRWKMGATTIATIDLPLSNVDDMTFDVRIYLNIYDVDTPSASGYDAYIEIKLEEAAPAAISSYIDHTEGTLDLTSELVGAFTIQFDGANADNAMQIHALDGQVGN